jgi:hypothetical protein
LKHADTVDKAAPMIEKDVHIKKIDRGAILGEVCTLRCCVRAARVRSLKETPFLFVADRERRQTRDACRSARSLEPSCAHWWASMRSPHACTLALTLARALDAKLKMNWNHELAMQEIAKKGDEKK